MTKADVQLLYEYDRWANNKVLQAASLLNAQQFTRDLGGSFRSVRDTLVHIIGGIPKRCATVFHIQRSEALAHVTTNMGYALHYLRAVG